MKYLAAVVMGLLASGLVYIVSIPLPSPAPTLIALTFWIASSFLLQRSAQTVAQVLGRGFLLGAGEWLLLIVAAIIYTLVAAPDYSMSVLIKSAFAAAMSVLCLAGFAVVQVWQRAKSPSVTKLV